MVTPEQEEKYLEHCPEPLKSIATVLSDSGMRPEQCYRMRWEIINWQHVRNVAVLVTHGKTAAARRSIPMTLRMRFILEARWEFPYDWKQMKLVQSKRETARAGKPVTILP